MQPPVFDELDLSQIQDERTRECIVRLLNLVEEVTSALRASQEENQRLRDEISRLKGEHGRPTIKGNKLLSSRPITPRTPIPSSAVAR